VHDLITLLKKFRRAEPDEEKPRKAPQAAACQLDPRPAALLAWLAK
jgi:hypothetical protein